jgi:glycosyltransferase involved in cell wall biosynthesis
VGELLGEGRGASRVAAITFAKQFPNAKEPLRGLFVLRQVLATAHAIDWRVIAPVPLAPRGLERLMRRPRVPIHEVIDGVEVDHPAYGVLPRQVDYARAGASMAEAARPAFDRASSAGAKFVHAHALYPSGEAARRLAVHKGVPLIATVHGSDLYTMLTRPSWTDVVRGVARDAAAIVCVSRRLAEDVVDHLGVGWEKVLVIPDAYDDSTYGFTTRTPRSHKAPVHLVCVGRLEPPKGQDVLVEAMGHLVSSGVRVTLTLVGGGSLEHRLRDRVRELGIEGAVDFRGPLAPTGIAEVLSTADLYVQPSRREGFGVALVEAMATGLPAVATASGGPADIVGPEDGVLVEPGDAAALSEGIAEAIGRLGTFDCAAIAGRIASRFASAVVGERLVRLYYDVLNGQLLSGGGRTDG